MEIADQAIPVTIHRKGLQVIIVRFLAAATWKIYS